MRVVQQGETFAVQSQKSENGQLMKCNIVLQEMGGKFENQYVATMLGNMATFKLAPGDVFPSRKAASNSSEMVILCSLILFLVFKCYVCEGLYGSSFDVVEVIYRDSEPLCHLLWSLVLQHQQPDDQCIALVFHLSQKGLHVGSGMAVFLARVGFPGVVNGLLALVSYQLRQGFQ